MILQGKNDNSPFLRMIKIFVVYYYQNGFTIWTHYESIFNCLRLHLFLNKPRRWRSGLERWGVRIPAAL